MKGFLSFFGKLVGMLGKAAALWGQGLALVPDIVQIMMSVQLLHGQGTGAEKRARFIELVEELVTAEAKIAKPLSPELQAALREAAGALADAAIAFDKVYQAIKAAG